MRSIAMIFLLLLSIGAVGCGVESGPAQPPENPEPPPADAPQSNASKPAMAPEL